MNYFVYLLRCIDNSFYTGIAIDLEKRVNQHNGLIKGGAIYTRNKRPVALIYSEEFKTRSEALKREYQIKKLSHKEKELLPTSSPAAASSST